MKQEEVSGLTFLPSDRRSIYRDQNRLHRRFAAAQAGTAICVFRGRDTRPACPRGTKRTSGPLVPTFATWRALLPPAAQDVRSQAGSGQSEQRIDLPAAKSRWKVMRFDDSRTSASHPSATTEHHVRRRKMGGGQRPPAHRSANAPCRLGSAPSRLVGRTHRARTRPRTRPCPNLTSSNSSPAPCTAPGRATYQINHEILAGELQRRNLLERFRTMAPGCV